MLLRGSKRKHDRICAAANNRMQRTCQNITPLAFARAAPFWHAADPER